MPMNKGETAQMALERLEAENAKLREDRDHWFKEAHDLLERYESGYRAFLAVRDERDRLLLQNDDYRRVLTAIAYASADREYYQEPNTPFSTVTSIARMVLDKYTEKPKCECDYFPHRYCRAHPSGPVVEKPQGVALTQDLVDDCPDDAMRAELQARLDATEKRKDEDLPPGHYRTHGGLIAGPDSSH